MNDTSSSLTRTAARTVRVSAVVGAVGLVFLAAMYLAFALDARPAALVFGWINDVSAVVMCPLLIPCVIAIHGLVGPRERTVSALVAAAGFAGIAWIVVWQAMLVLGMLTFEQEVGPVMVGYLALAAWFVGSGWLAGRAGLVQRGAWMGLLAASYIGYPIWAMWIGGRLEAIAGGSTLRTRVATE